MPTKKGTPRGARMLVDDEQQNPPVLNYDQVKSEQDKSQPGGDMIINYIDGERPLSGAASSRIDAKGLKGNALGSNKPSKEITPPKSGTYTPFQGSSNGELEAWLREQLDANRPETKEQREKRERREKWEGIINGISGMGSALGNLYFTTKGAPNAYDATTGMSAKTRERWERDKAERERNTDRWINYALKLKELERMKTREAREKLIEQRQDNDYEYALSRRKANEDMEDAKLQDLKRKNNRDIMYDELEELRSKYAAGEMTLEEYRKQQSEIYNAYHGKAVPTYTRTTSETSGTVDKVSTNDPNQLQAPVAKQVTSGKKGGGGGKDKVATETYEEYIYDKLGRKVGKRVHKGPVTGRSSSGRSGNKGNKGTGYGKSGGKGQGY